MSPLLGLRPGRARRVIPLLGCGLVAALVAGCSSARASSQPTWVPQASVSPVELPHQVPASPAGSGTESGGPAPSPAAPTSAGQSPSPGAPPAPSPTGTSAVDPNVVATKLTAPVGLAVLPDATALVAERTTGRILLVQPVAGTPAKLVKTLSGLDIRAGGGVLDIALSATYAEDGLILALVTTKTDVRVVHFTLGGTVTPILTGIPRSATANSGRLLVRGDGSGLVGTGDGGQPALSTDPRSLAGKVLRIDDLGKPAQGNPSAGSRIFTSGHQRVDGLCAGADGAGLFEVEADRTDEVNVLGPGSSFGAGGAKPAATPTVTKGAGGCAVIGTALFVTGLGGKDVFTAPILGPGSLGAFTPVLAGKYGRMKTVVAGADGTLWLTTSNKDGHGRPVADDERVLHIRPSGGGGTNPA